jgi:hypothetical protein
MDAELTALTELREKPAGTVRLTATEYARNLAASLRDDSAEIS